MKFNLSLILSFLIANLALAQSVKRCDFESQLIKLQDNDDYIRQSLEIENQIVKGQQLKSETVFLIPVVFHIIWNENSPEQNISEAQIQSQLDVLNKDFRKLNADTSNVEAEFSKADVRIEFCLARRDPNGNETDGINRIPTSLANIGLNEQYYQIQPAWDRNKYLNIWVGRYGQIGNNEVLGRASPPGDPDTTRDGVIITYTAFGTIGTARAPYNKGRTTTHEVGHWLGLFHPWGINFADCSDDDQVIDTPNQGVEYYDCPIVSQFSCGSKDMLSNFMGYVDDDCMGNFSEGQKSRMRSTIVGSRTKLLLSNGCLPVGLEEFDLEESIRLYPNPANDLLTVRFDKGKQDQLELRILDIKGALQRTETYENEKEIRINTAILNNGIYILEIRNEVDVFRTKIIVQH